MESAYLMNSDIGSVVVAVAQGAAIQAGILDGQITDLFVMDVWQASLMRAFAEQQGRWSAFLRPDLLNLVASSPDESIHRCSESIVLLTLAPSSIYIMYTSKALLVQHVHE
eukprot:scaffold157545_cov19-Prasinocladus_malaysianus.AAC.1